MRGCFAGPREGGRGGWQGRLWQRAPSFCVRLGPAAPRVEGTAARAEDRGRRRVACAGCGGHASPGIRGLRPGPGGGGGRKGGRGLGRGAFPVARSIPGLRGLSGAGRGAGSARGLGWGEGSSSAWGAPPGDRRPGVTDPGLGPSSHRQRVSGTPPPSLPGPAPSFPLFPFKISLARMFIRCLVWGSFTETKQFSQEEKKKTKKRRNVPSAPDGCGANMASMGKSRAWGQERGLGSLGLEKGAGPGLGDWGPIAALPGISVLWGCSQRLWCLGTRF